MRVRDMAQTTSPLLGVSNYLESGNGEVDGSQSFARQR
jgi:hypothetical protein